MKIHEAITKACNILSGSNTPQLDAEVILSSLLNKERVYLYLNRTEELPEDTEDEFFQLIDRRSKHEPVQYITGKQEFMSMDFIVKPGVLIPRPDTEILVEEVITNISKMEKPVIIDVGCGSGAISVSLAKYKTDAVVYALDIMDIPLEITKINSENNGVGDRIRTIKSDILKGFSRNLENSVDVIVSNPPYIRDEVIPGLMKSVREYEPYEALSGREDGLFFYRQITKGAYELLRTGGLLAFEIGYDQGDEVVSILRDSGFINIKCIKDLAGLDRVVTGWRN